MPNDQRRANARRRAWGRGPMVLRFEPLEGRELLATTAVALPDLTAAQFDVPSLLDWGDAFQARGEILNQGDAPASSPFHVNIYASTTPGLTADSVLIGQVNIPAGLGPGLRLPFSQEVRLPMTAPPGIAPSGSLFIGLQVDPDGFVVEGNESNNSGNGLGLDTTAVTIAPRLPSALAGNSIGVYPDQTQWGQSIKVSAQIRNEGAGDAPPTRARVVLTPSGHAPGSGYDVTVGSLQVPAVANGQMALVSQTIDLPSVPPVLLSGSDQFLISIAQDADFVADPFSPHRANRGPGIDMAPVLISAPSGYALDPNSPLPDLVTASVQAPTLPLAMGQTFQVTATVQNQGQLDSGPFRVRFLLVGTDGSLETAMFLADATLAGLKSGFGQDVVQTLRLPGNLPRGATLDPNARVRIAVLIDPDSVFDEWNKSNNLGISDVVSLQVVGTDGQVTIPAQTTPPIQTDQTAPQAQSVGTIPVTTPRARTPVLPSRRVASQPAQTLRMTGTTPTYPPRVGTPASAAAANRRPFGPRAPRSQASAGLRVYPRGRQNPALGSQGTP